MSTFDLALLKKRSPERLLELEDAFEATPDGWAGLTLSLASQDDELEAVPVYPGTSATLCNLSALTDSLRLCRSHAWGKELGLALATISTDDRALFDEPPTTRLWVDTAVQAGAHDLLELPESQFGIGQAVPGEVFRQGFIRLAHNRRSAMKRRSAESLAASSWVTRAKAIRLNCLLDSSFQRSGASDRSIIVVDVATEKAQVKLVAAKAEASAAKAIEIATLRVGEKPGLTKLREELKIPPAFDFRTELELFYFARWLYAVEQAPRPTLAERSLLITNTFDADEDPALTLAAARDVGSIFYQEPRVPVEVDRRCTPRSLARHLKQTDGPLVWLHLGHGLGSRGLRGADGRDISAEQWIDSFVSSGCEVRAAVLLSCDSKPMIKALRDKLEIDWGFGFEGKLGPDDGRRFSEALLPDLLGGADRPTLHDAYRRALRALRTEGSAASPFSLPTLDD